MPEADSDRYIGVLARSAAYLCLYFSELGDKGVATKARLLEGLGLTRKEIASILGTTEETVRVELGKARRGKGGKKAAHGPKANQGQE